MSKGQWINAQELPVGWFALGSYARRRLRPATAFKKHETTPSDK